MPGVARTIRRMIDEARRRDALREVLEEVAARALALVRAEAATAGDGGPRAPEIASSMTTTPIDNIRNFSIVAHIDHGKSTLADRLIQATGTVALRDMSEQMLDSMDIEKERGITIKANTVRLEYKAEDGKDYVLNLMDTPGHVDFAYEVSRSLAACEGALLVVDAAQGVEAQSVANCYTAVEMGLEVVPVLNKIDLPTADTERAKAEIEAVIGIDATDAVPVSAKTGLNVEEVLEAIVHRIPPPVPRDTDKLQALIIDSWFDNYLGVVSLVRVMQGELKAGDAWRPEIAEAVLFLSSPRASFGLRMLAASMAPSAAPAPTRLWISSMNRMMSPRLLISLSTFFMRSSKSPR